MTKFKIIESKFKWISLNLYFLDYILQNISKEEENLDDDLLMLFINEFKIILFGNESSLNYSLIDYNIFILNPIEQIKQIDISDDNFIEKSFDLGSSGEKHLLLFDELDNLLFDDNYYNDTLGLTIDELTEIVSYYFEKDSSSEKLIINTKKLHLAEIWKHKLKDALTSYMRNNLEEEFEKIKKLSSDKDKLYSSKNIEIEKTKLYHKKLKRFNKYILFINNNQYFLYLINKYVSTKLLPSDEIQTYEGKKEIFENH